MHDHPAIFFAALLIFLFGLISHLSTRSPVTAPMFFMAVGVLVSPLGLNIYAMKFNADATKILAEITLILILFVDASMIPFTRLKETLAGIPARLLGIGLPLTMLLGGLIGYLMFPSLDIWLIAMVALILSPTDAALGQAIIKSPHIPARIRESVSIESGLNDGIALPLIVVCIAVLTEGSQVIDGSGRWITFMVSQLTLGPIVGAAVGWLGGKLVEKAAAMGWSEPTFQRLSSISLALMAYAFAELAHGNGFIAAFFAGLLLGAKTPVVRERIQEFGEAEGHMLSLFVFLLLGLIMIPVAAQYWTLPMLVYALLSLTLIRMLPVAICLIGTGLDKYTIGFLGWFGPRGIASVLYLLIAVGELGFAGYEHAMSLIVLTVLLSTVLHGVSALPLANHYKRITH
ncbi:MAG: sodium:proton antiporter [Moraxellaceae bacterium]|nr:MAG: sodium:proton antiporter [Moraxellaceae bacterium]